MLPICSWSISARRLALLGVVTVLAFAAPAARADGPALEAAVLKKVKAATVRVTATLPDGKLSIGSGFFTDEAGVLVTTSHVLQMIDPESRKPTKIEITFTDEMGKTRTLPATVAGIDRGTELAVLRVDDKELPDPLPLGATRDLRETATLYVFGYPFGKDLGKEITVGKSAVSRLQKNGDSLIDVQLDPVQRGGSGGPITDEKGNVIGVATNNSNAGKFGHAVPADFVTRFLNGRLYSASLAVPYKDGDQVMLPVTLYLVDPLSRIKALDVQVWGANAGAPRPGSPKEPAALPGDTPKKRYSMKYDGKTLALTTDVPVPTLTDAKQVYWVQPIFTNSRNETVWLRTTTRVNVPPLERRAVTLKYQPKGKQTAELISIGDFKVRQDGEEHSINMNFKMGLTEQFGEPLPKVFPMRLSYGSIVLGLKVDNKPVQSTDDIQKILRDTRFMAADFEMDKDGSVATSKADLRKVPKETQGALDDLSDQVLMSLEVLAVPFPEREIKPLETWKVQRNIMIGSGIIAVPAQADIVYTYKGVQVRDGKEGVLLYVSGRVKGRRGDGLNVSGTVDGTAYVSLETGEVLHGAMTVKSDLDFEFGRKPAKAFGTLEVSVQRPIPEKK